MSTSTPLSALFARIDALAKGADGAASEPRTGWTDNELSTTALPLQLVNTGKTGAPAVLAANSGSYTAAGESAASSPAPQSLPCYSASAAPLPVQSLRCSSSVADPAAWAFRSFLSLEATAGPRAGSALYAKQEVWDDAEAGGAASLLRGPRVFDLPTAPPMHGLHLLQRPLGGGMDGDFAERRAAPSPWWRGNVNTITGAALGSAQGSNSSSVHRPLANRALFATGSSSFVPFRPGGLDDDDIDFSAMHPAAAASAVGAASSTSATAVPVAADDVRAAVSQETLQALFPFDFSADPSKLLRIPPGFTRGLMDEVDVAALQAQAAGDAQSDAAALEHQAREHQKLATRKARDAARASEMHSAGSKLPQHESAFDSSVDTANPAAGPYVAGVNPAELLSSIGDSMTDDSLDSYRHAARTNLHRAALRRTDKMRHVSEEADEALFDDEDETEHAQRMQALQMLEPPDKTDEQKQQEDADAAAATQEEDLLAELDLTLPSGGATGEDVSKRRVDAKLLKLSNTWATAERLDVSNFHAQIPQMAIRYPFELDPFQKEAILHLERGESVFVAAHTSAGKTVVAEYAIALSARHLTRAVYTSPIKTLSNQKFREFRCLHVDTLVATTEGPVRAGDITMEHELLGQDGQVVRVCRVEQQSTRAAYKVASAHTSYTVSSDHRLTLRWNVDPSVTISADTNANQQRLVARWYDAQLKSHSKTWRVTIKEGTAALDESSQAVTCSSESDMEPIADKERRQEVFHLAAVNGDYKAVDGENGEVECQLAGAHGAVCAHLVQGEAEDWTTHLRQCHSEHPDAHVCSPALYDSAEAALAGALADRATNLSSGNWRRAGQLLWREAQSAYSLSFRDASGRFGSKMYPVRSEDAQKEAELCGNEAELRATAWNFLASVQDVMRAGDLFDITAAELAATWSQLRMDGEGVLPNCLPHGGQCASGRLVPLPMEVTLPHVSTPISAADAECLAAFDEAAAAGGASDADAAVGQRTSLRRFTLKAASGGAFVPVEADDVAVGPVYQLLSPLVPSEDEEVAAGAASGDKALTFLNLSAVHKDLDVDVAAAGVVIDELQPLATQAVNSACLSAYKKACYQSISDVLSRRATRVLAFGRSTRERWIEYVELLRQQGLASEVEEAAVSTGQLGLAVRQMSFTFEQRRVGVFFTVHPACWAEYLQLAAAVALVHEFSAERREELLAKLRHSNGSIDPLRSLTLLAEETAVSAIEVVPDRAGLQRFALASGVLTHNSTFGEKDVGVITGDVSINPEASCLVLTTEILRSMLYKGADLIRDIEWVIFDEVHYVNDAERGVVWEEVIIMLPPHVNFVLLSATVPNTLEFADWVGRTKRKPIFVIATDKRPVPLQHFLWNKNKLFQIMDGATGRFLPEGFKAARAEGLTAKVKEQQKRGYYKRPSLRQAKSSWVVLIQFLKTQELLPVVIFAFSKKVCEDCAFGLTHLDLTSSAEKSEITVQFASALQRLQPNDRKLPQVLRVRELVRRGLGLHHAGMLPILKELVEMLFTRGLLKVLFSTETFAMGVNAPTKTVVFYSIKKHDGQSFRELLPGEYTQMSGRAGRRGLDKFGIVIINSKNDEVPDELAVKQMLQGRPSKLESRFRLTYNMILNLLRQEDMKVEEFIRRSFGELTTAKETPRRKMLLEKGERKLRHQRPVECRADAGGLGCSHESMAEFFHLTHEVARIQTHLFESLFVPGSAASSKYLSIGRVMVLNIRGLENCAAVVLRNQLPQGGAAASASASSAGDLNRKPYVAFVLVPPLQSLSVKYVSQARSLGLVLGSTSGVGGPKLHYLLSDFGPSHIVALLNEKIEVDVPGVLVDRFPRKMDMLAMDLLGKVQEKFGTPVSAAAHAAAVEAGIAQPLPAPGPAIGGKKPPLPVLPRALHPNRLPAQLLMDPLSDIKLHVGGGDEDGSDNFQLLDEQYLKTEYQKQLASSPVHQCPKAAEHYSAFLRQHALKTKVSQLRALLSHDNLDLHADFTHRMSVLARLGYVAGGHSSKSTVQLKGRVACEINTCHSLVVTELIFENALTRLEPEEIVAVLSCLIFQEKQADEPVLPERLIAARAELERVARSVAQLELQCGLDVDPADFVRDNLNSGLMQVVWEWAKGTKFSDICAFTNVLEGSIVRCITRLDETCRDVRNAARVIGDAPLAAKMQRASELIKRDIVFAASLYVA